MKKIIALLSLFLIFISCSSDNDEGNVHFELVPITTVVLPATFEINTDNKIEINYLRPTTCHGFDGFYYDIVGQTRTVAIQNYVVERNNCAPLTSQSITQELNFRPTTSGTYTFRFWQGKDSNGANIFLDEVIIVP